MRANEQGFTLIETLVAMAVLTIGIVALYAMQVSSMRGNHVANVVSQASNYNTLNLEQLLIHEFDGARLKDRNGDGKNKDDGNGVDQSGKEFGLNGGADLDPMTSLSNCRAEADWCEDSKDGLYRIIYNVVENQPVIGVKTIRMHVRSKVNPQLRPVTYELIRNDPDTGF